MRFCFRDSTVAPHRYAWELEIGPLPPNTYLKRKCATPLCIRPHHWRIYGGDLTNGQRKRRRSTIGEQEQAVLVRMVSEDRIEKLSEQLGERFTSELGKLETKLATRMDALVRSVKQLEEVAVRRDTAVLDSTTRARDELNVELRSIKVMLSKAVPPTFMFQSPKEPDPMHKPQEPPEPPAAILEAGQAAHNGSPSLPNDLGQALLHVFEERGGLVRDRDAAKTLLIGAFDDALFRTAGVRRSAVVMLDEWMRLFFTTHQERSAEAFIESLRRAH